MNIPGPGRRWISCAEAAVYLSVHEMTIRAWVNEGRIPAARIGRAVRVDFRALERQLEAQASMVGQKC